MPNNRLKQTWHKLQPQILNSYAAQGQSRLDFVLGGYHLLADETTI